MTEPPPLVLASSSRTRRELLTRLGLPFESHPPEVDETRRDGEAPAALARRLARAKAAALATRFPDHLLIGADQVAAVGERVYGKPDDVSAATAQLRELSGRTVQFWSALCVLAPAGGREQHDVVEDRVTLRALDAGLIARYLAHDAPFDCAGALRSEGLGITLCTRIESVDPTALLGLPLIRLAEFLRREGYILP